jgi:hypothetical protein
LRSLQHAVVLVAILSILGGGCGGSATLGAAALAQQAKSLESHAAEGALLAQDAAAGRTTAVYTRGHASDLYRAASHALTSLRTADVQPALEPKLRRLQALAAQVAGELGSLGGASSDERRALGRELEAAARVSRTIGDELT